MKLSCSIFPARSQCMVTQILASKPTKLFIFLGGFFIANAMLAEFIGIKIFSLEKTFGFAPLAMNLFGVKDLGFNLTAGVLLWPVVFVMTDIINEYYGRKGVRFLSWLAVILILYAFLMAFLAIKAFIGFLTRYGFKLFGWYRIIVGLIIIGLSLAGVNLNIL